MKLEVKRQFFQIYTEFEALPFNGTTKTQNTLRAWILEYLAQFGFREVIPKRKERYGFVEDLIRLRDPEAEIKYGISCQTFYIQVSVSDKTKLFILNNQILVEIRKWGETNA